MTNKLCSITNQLEIKWPPHCCVPAFLHAALGKCEVALPDPLKLPGLLGVQVGPNDLNPLQLDITKDLNQRGITREQAMACINDYFKKFYPALMFRHIPFKEIQFQMYEDVLASELGKGSVVGIGVDFTMLSNGSGDICRHVLRVESLIKGKAVLFDDSHELNQPQIEVDFFKIEQAALSISDGYWVVGKSIAI